MVEKNTVKNVWKYWDLAKRYVRQNAYMETAFCDRIVKEKAATLLKRKGGLYGSNKYVRKSRRWGHRS